MPSHPSERALAARLAAHQSWANTTDRSARTSHARRTFDQRFLDEAAGDPVRAEHLRKAYFARLALKSAQARRRAAEARRIAPLLDAEADAADAELTGAGDAA